MVLLTAIIINSVVVSLFLTVASAVSCNDAIGYVANLVSPLPEAQSFCSRKYPVPVVTISSTVPGATMTVSVTVPYTYTGLPTTITTTVATVTSTVTESDTATTIVISTDTETSIFTETLTSTETSYLPAKKKKKRMNTSISTTKSISTTDAAVQTTKATTPSPKSSTTASQKSTTPGKINETPTTTPAATTSKSTNIPITSGKTTSITTTKASTTIRDPRSSALSSFLSAKSEIIASICSCIQIARTTTVVVTASSGLTTITVTATTVTIPTAVVSVIKTETTVTTTTETTAVSTITTVTDTETSTSFTTVSTTVARPVNAPQCDPSGAGNSNAGGGGCSNNCYCDPTVGGTGVAYCVSDNSFINNPQACTTDHDCPPTKFCDPAPAAPGRICANGDGCTSTYKVAGAKRWLFGSLFDHGMKGRARSKRAVKIEELRQKWAEGHGV